MSDHFIKTLNRVRNEPLAGLSDTDREAYIRLVDWLRKTDVASHVLQVGDTAPDFFCPMSTDGIDTLTAVGRSTLPTAAIKPQQSRRSMPDEPQRGSGGEWRGGRGVAER